MYVKLSKSLEHWIRHSWVLEDNSALEWSTTCKSLYDPHDSRRSVKSVCVLLGDQTSKFAYWLITSQLRAMLINITGNAALVPC